MSEATKYYLIAGEPSGDLHGAHLIRALKQRTPESTFRAWGGDKMAGEGAEIVTHYREMAFMGFVEVLQNIFTILGLMRKCKADILAHKPDVLILIDYPGFNMRIAKFARANRIKVAYYIAPQVWAWKESRVAKLKNTTDAMLVILPFEKEFYARHGMEVTYVGHPLLNHLQPAESREQVSEAPAIALLPGSRKQEIGKILPEMLKVTARFPNASFIIGMAPSQDIAFYESVVKSVKGVSLYAGATYDLLRNADAALVTSGTATLETALIGLPQVVCYKTSSISYRLARFFIRVKYISLVNLIADRAVVTELIQDELNTDRIESELTAILQPDIRKRMFEDYAEIRKLLGGGGASERAADAVVKLLHQ
jgi:lipid-A-disaccharide synthase